MKNIQVIKPLNPLLRPYVDYYLFPTLDQQYLQKAADGKLEVLPSPGASIILFFSEPSYYVKDNNLEHYQEFILTGIYSSPKKIVRHTTLDQMIIKFSPVGIQLLLDFQISEIIDTYVSIESVFKTDFNGLQFELRNSRTNEDRVRSFETLMINKLGKIKSIDKRAISLVQYICKNKGTQSIKEISKELGIGERTIQRNIHKYVGINFKFLSKLIRFQEASKCLRMSDYKNKITELAYELNYFDQSHFIHDFKSFSNLTPSQFLDKQKNDDLYDMPNKIAFR